MTINKKINLLFILGLIIISSCASKKDIIYFNDINIKEQDKTVFSTGKIQANDILNIVVSSSSPELAMMYNKNSNSNSITDYLVTSEGIITMPILGKIEVQGITLLELENLLVKKLIEGNHLANPIVTARLLNAKFTVLGEVKTPGTYSFVEQNISVLQALGYAGDLTIYGKRQDVLIIREENNIKTYMTIDLTSKQWFDSPYYYIKPNDVIYVNPNGTKVKSSGYISNIGSLLGVISIVVSTIFILTN